MAISRSTSVIMDDNGRRRISEKGELVREIQDKRALVEKLPSTQHRQTLDLSAVMFLRG